MRGVLVRRGAWVAAALMVGCTGAATAATAAAGQAGAPEGRAVGVSRGAHRAGRLAPTAETGSAKEKAARAVQQLRVRRSASGDVAVVDESMAAYGALCAVSSRAVELDWETLATAAGYRVLRNGGLLTTLPRDLSTFRDITVIPGSEYRYTIEPVGGDGSRSDAANRMWSFKVRVPKGSDRASLEESATVQALAAGVAATSTVSWVTFIPPAKVDAPAVGCSYGSGYQYGGDNRSYDWTSSRYRTAVHAVVTWSTKAVSGSVSARPTTVYKKSTGALVATRTTSMAASYAKKLGSGSNYADVRLVTHAGNPFCTANAIDGAFSMHLTQTGNYSFISGNHRQAPNHHVYIYDGGGVTDVYRRNNAGFICLAGSAICALANFYGSGAF